MPSEHLKHKFSFKTIAAATLVIFLPLVWSWMPCGIPQNRRNVLIESIGAMASTFAFVLHPGPCHSVEEQGQEEERAVSCDEACRQERLRVIRERRAMMQQSRSSTSRQEVFDLSRQRATLYNTTYQGASCPPGIPCP